MRTDAALEVTVARKHGRDQQVLRLDRRRDLVGQGAGVADTGGAAIANEVETERVEIVLQFGLVQVVGDDLGTGGKRGLDPGLDLQSLGDRVAGQKPRGDQHAGVGGVGAGSDRGDHHVAVRKAVVLAFDGNLTHELMLAGIGPALCGELAFGAGRVHAALVRKKALEGPGCHVQRDLVLGTLRAGDGGNHRGNIELQAVCEDRVRGRIVVPHSLGPGISLDQLDAGLVTAGKAQVAQRFLVDREDRAGGAELRRHVAKGRTVGETQMLEAGAVELHELADHALVAQHLGGG